MLKKMLQEKNLPPFKSRDEMLEILLREEYGYLPPKPDSLEFESKCILPNFCAGKAVLNKVEITAKFGGKSFTFPIYATIPTKEGKYPFFIHINFRSDVPDRYMPTEEIVDNGFAVLSFNHKDVSSDDNDMTNGLAGVLFENGERGDTDPGKLAMWAWAAHRALDYAETLPMLDTSKCIVCGHSRLGKTALLTAATDERFAMAHSNDSGCSGAAISRGKVGESVGKICEVFPYWFCKNYFKYAGKENEMPFDQHYLVASIAPRKAYVASAVEDVWADPSHEMLSCVAASEVYEKLGLTGLVCENRLPEPGDVYHEGNIGYHLRYGTHYFSREDWLRLMEYVKKHF